MPPMIIPIAVEPAKCPYCKAPEDKVEICRTCKHEYDEEKLTPLEILFAIPIGIIGFGIIVGIFGALLRFFFIPILDFTLFGGL